jgi:hypothetical protein
MALGPHVLDDKVRRLRQAEQMIDAAIRSHGGGTMRLACELLPIDQGDWQELALEYKKAGWQSALWVSGPPGGDYIELKT